MGIRCGGTFRNCNAQDFFSRTILELIGDKKRPAKLVIDSTNVNTYHGVSMSKYNGKYHNDCIKFTLAMTEDGTLCKLRRRASARNFHSRAFAVTYRRHLLYPREEALLASSYRAPRSSYNPGKTVSSRANLWYSRKKHRTCDKFFS